MTEAKPKPTPGPWEWVAYDTVYCLKPGVLMTEFSDGTPWGDEKDRANAHLIKSAPDLLAALEDILLIPEFWNQNRRGPEIDAALAAGHAAIAKARGEAA